MVNNRLKDFPYSDPAFASCTDWIVGPASQCRDSDEVEANNFGVLCGLLDDANPYGNEWMIIRFSHFGVGWIDMVFARPGAATEAVLATVRESLSCNPILSGAE